MSASNSSKVLVKWTQGRSKGTTSWVKSKDVKGQFKPGETVKVIWGKSKKLHEAVIQESPLSPIVPNQAPTSRIVNEDFSFDLGSPFSIASPNEPATTVTQQSQSSDFNKILTRLEEIQNTISSQGAHLLARLDSSEKGLNARLERLGKTMESFQISQSGTSTAPTVSDISPNDLAPFQIADDTGPGTVTSPPLQMALQDITLQLQHSFNLQEYVIPESTIYSSLIACKSRRNLASRLATQVFTVEERTTSNSRGLCGKKALDPSKLKAIHEVAVKNYPLERLETKASVEKEMRTAIDEACRKTKNLA